MKRLITTVWLILTTVLLIFSILFFVAWSEHKFTISSLFKHDKELSAIVLQHQLEDIGELATEKYFFSEMERREDVLEFLDIDGWDMPWTRNEMVITFEGYVLAGISDFSAIKIDVNDKSDKITVTLPDVEILGVTIDHDSVRTYDIEDNVFNRIPTDAQVEMLEDAEEDIVEDAIDDGILDKARDHLQELIETLIESMIEGTSYADYSISFKWK